MKAFALSVRERVNQPPATLEDSSFAGDFVYPGPLVAESFALIVKKRNALAKKLGYEDYYDMKVQQAEGFSKRRLFEIMDGLEEQTRPIMEAAR